MHKITLEKTVYNINEIRMNLKLTLQTLDEYYINKAENLEEKMDLILDMFNIVNAYKQTEKDLEDFTTQLQIKNEEEEINGN